MQQEQKEELKINLDAIYDEFNNILAEKGFDDFNVKSFSLIETRLLTCVDLRRVCDINGRCYMKCFD